VIAVRTVAGRIERGAFTRRRPLLSGKEARKRILVCLAAEQSLLEGREVALRF
jgi:hypothetical protein